jgi:hypothetical protein
MPPVTRRSPSSAKRASPSKAPTAKRQRADGEPGTLGALFRQAKAVDVHLPPAPPAFEERVLPASADEAEALEASSSVAAASAAPNIPLTREEDDELKAFVSAATPDSLRQIPPLMQSERSSDTPRHPRRIWTTNMGLASVLPAHLAGNALSASAWIRPCESWKFSRAVRMTTRLARACSPRTSHSEPRYDSAFLVCYHSNCSNSHT